MNALSNRVSHALPVLLMLLLGGLSLWLKQAIEGPAQVTRPKGLHDADATVERFTVTRLGPDGAPESRLSAQRMVHFGDDDSTELVLPQLFRNEPGVTVTVRAERGLVTRDYEDAHFYDRVELVRNEQGARDELRVRTEYLHVLIRQDVLRTDRPVTIRRGNSMLSGVGMEYDRKAGRISLLSGVKASFDATRR